MNSARRPEQAVYNFIYRNAASGEFSKEFRGDNFAQNFPRYYGQSAIPESHRDALRTIMTCKVCLDGFDHVHQHLHEHDVIQRDCRDNQPYGRPEESLHYLGLAVVLLVASIAALQPFGLSLLGGWERPVGSLVGLAGAAWLFHRSRYSSI